MFPHSQSLVATTTLLQLPDPKTPYAAVHYCTLLYSVTHEASLQPVMSHFTINLPRAALWRREEAYVVVEPQVNCHIFPSMACSNTNKPYKPYQTPIFTSHTT